MAPSELPDVAGRAPRRRPGLRPREIWEEIQMQHSCYLCLISRNWTLCWPLEIKCNPFQQRVAPETSHGVRDAPPPRFARSTRRPRPDPGAPQIQHEWGRGRGSTARCGWPLPGEPRGTLAKGLQGRRGCRRPPPALPFGPRPPGCAMMSTLQPAASCRGGGGIAGRGVRELDAAAAPGGRLRAGLTQQGLADSLGNGTPPVPAPPPQPISRPLCMTCALECLSFPHSTLSIHPSTPCPQRSSLPAPSPRPHLFRCHGRNNHLHPL